MSGRRVPGDPTPRELAAADQRFAQTREALTQLVQLARGEIVGVGGGQPGFQVWLTVAMDLCLDAAGPLTVNDKGRDDLAPALCGLLSEAVLRLARVDEAAGAGGRVQS